MQRLLFLLFTGLVLFASACDKDGANDDEPMTIDFDRRAMLTVWSEAIISPAYSGFNDQLGILQDAWETYLFESGDAELADFKVQFDAAYANWQRLSPVLMGKAEEIRLRAQVNTYPTDVDLIGQNVVSATAINFDLPSQTTAQGLPALDYILYGSDAAARLTDAGYRVYVSRLIERMRALTTIALDDWRANAEAFVQNDGNSATASIDRTVNDYIFHYEKFLRAGKVGIPSGAFSDDPLPNRAESLYGGKSKILFQQSLLYAKSFFERPRSLTGYLDALNVMRDGELLSIRIKNQFGAIEDAAADLNEDFALQVSTDNGAMLALYDEMQKLVVLLKVDMLQALSINVDYVDADGD